jgi:hypothetical protein
LAFKKILNFGRQWPIKKLSSPLGGLLVRQARFGNFIPGAPKILDVAAPKSAHQYSALLSG